MQSGSGKKGRLDRTTRGGQESPCWGDREAPHLQVTWGGPVPFSVSASFSPGVDHFPHGDLLEVSTFCILQPTLPALRPQEKVGWLPSPGPSESCHGTLSGSSCGPWQLGGMGKNLGTRAQEEAMSPPPRRHSSRRLL